MKKYQPLDTSLNWQNLLPLLVDEKMVLLNHPNSDFVLGWGLEEYITLQNHNFSANRWQKFIDLHSNEYLFGYLSYDLLNNETRGKISIAENLSEDTLFLFVPKHVIIHKAGQALYYGNLNSTELELLVQDLHKTTYSEFLSEEIDLKTEVSHDEYVNNVNAIKNEIQNGTIYEMNYCLEFSANYQHLNTLNTYKKLIELSQAPFAAFVNDGTKTVLCASPERFLKKDQQTLISQPIKGTAKRGENKLEDQVILENLRTDPKEISENVMIVDLVRNDLSKVATKNSVHVTELCQPYSFKTVHQLISTVLCEVKPEKSFTEILQALFPMGSMTGAPKISAMEQINRFENFNRGIYSGAIGYMEPNGNFDFNVVIRSILVNPTTKKVTCSVGGAITINSIPENEYEECLLKLNAVKKTLC
jgi:para-aminobenzoate synthetase component 1